MNWEVFIPQAALVMVALIGGYFTLRGKRVDSETAAIGSLQKQITDMKTEHAAEKISLQGQIDGLKGRERVRDDYIYRLRNHIDMRKDPPPPEWPEELTGYRS